MDTEPYASPPKHPVHAMTSGELSTYRRQLEHAVERLGQAPVVSDIQAKLADVLAEEDQRTRLRRAIGR